MVSAPTHLHLPSGAHVSPVGYEEEEVRPLTPSEQADKALADKMSDMRDVRNRRLADCDWTQHRDSPLTEAQQDAWATYRQALRDMPEAADPFDPLWPTPPGEAL